MRIRVSVARRPEPREVPAEVQFEVAANPVTDTTELGTAGLRTGQGQHWEDHVIAHSTIVEGTKMLIGGLLNVIVHRPGCVRWMLNCVSACSLLRCVALDWVIIFSFLVKNLIAEIGSPREALLKTVSPRPCASRTRSPNSARVSASSQAEVLAVDPWPFRDQATWPRGCPSAIRQAPLLRRSSPETDEFASACSLARCVATVWVMESCFA
jgi:hypothetical protein